MKKFIKLLSFELDRVWKIYVVLLGLTLVLQLMGVIVKSEMYMGQVKKAIQENGMTKADFLNQYGRLEFGQILKTNAFSFSIIICVVTLGILIFWIWYRDWLGKNTFIYRLLMLPTSRFNVYFAKLGALLLGVFGLIAFQLLLLPCEMKLYQAMVPQEFRPNFPLAGELWNGSIFAVILPPDSTDFVFFYFIGIMLVLVLFTAILIERSYHLKGIILAIGYTGLSIIFFLAPAFIALKLSISYFYPFEFISLEVILGIIVCGASIGTSHYLLRRKITV